MNFMRSYVKSAGLPAAPQLLIPWVPAQYRRVTVDESCTDWNRQSHLSAPHSAHEVLLLSQWCLRHNCTHRGGGTIRLLDETMVPCDISMTIVDRYIGIITATIDDSMSHICIIHSP